MGGLLGGGSILAAFAGGAVALFSPCCIVFLLPSYLAAAAKNHRWRLLPLTATFAAGLGLVLVPLTLGVGILAATLTRFHTALYLGGGLLLLALAGLSLAGRSWSLPSRVRAPALERADTAGMLALGVFSGVASSCCVPVLAGVMTLSALSSSVPGSVVLGLAYVFGMTFPLLVLALAWDHFGLGSRRLLQARPVHLRLAGRAIATNTVNLVVAVAFALMGVVVLVLAATGKTSAAPGFQVSIGRWLSDGARSVLPTLERLPEALLILGLLGLAALFVVAARLGRPSRTHQEAPEPARRCQS